MDEIKGAIEQDSFFYVKELQKDFNLSWNQAIDLILKSVKSLANKTCTGCKQKLTSDNWSIAKYENSERLDYCKNCA